MASVIVDGLRNRPQNLRISCRKVPLHRTTSLTRLSPPRRMQTVTSSPARYSRARSTVSHLLCFRGTPKRAGISNGAITSHAWLQPTERAGHRMPLPLASAHARSSPARATRSSRASMGTSSGTVPPARCLDRLRSTVRVTDSLRTSIPREMIDRTAVRRLQEGMTCVGLSCTTARSSQVARGTRSERVRS